MDPVQGYASDQLLSVQPPPPREEIVSPSDEKAEAPLEEEKGKIVDTTA